MRAYWFSQNGIAQHGSLTAYEVRPKPYKEMGEIIPCLQGLHASEHPYDAFRYYDGPTLDLVELGGTIVAHNDPVDKYAASERTHLKRIDATPLLREFARWCALQVADRWSMTPLVRRFLETGDLNLSHDAYVEAREAAYAAPDPWSRAAAWSAAYVGSAAMYNAAESAVAGAEFPAVIRKAQRQKFQELVDQAFAQV